jgi:hypothetical protein
MKGLRVVRNRAARVGITLSTLAIGSLAAVAMLPGTASAKPVCGSSAGTYYTQVKADHPLAYFRLDETTGPTACDDSGNGNNGTYASSDLTYGVTGALKSSTDTAISSDGTIDPVTVNSSSLPTGSPNFTLEGWFATKSTQDQMLVDMGQEGQDQVVGLGMWNSGSLLYIDLYQDDLNFAIPSTDKILNGKWHFIAVTHSATSGKFVAYLDGKKLGSAAHGALNLAGGTLRIGWWVDTVFNQPFNGSMDEVAAFPAVLTAKQITAQYTASGH